MADGAVNGLLGGGSGAEEPDEGRMPFLAHLGELRRRILVSLIAVGVGFVLAFNFSEPIINWLARPLRSAQRTDAADPHRRLPSAAEVDARVEALFPGATYTAEQRQFLKTLTPAQLDGKEDSKVTVTVGGQPREFKAQNYLYHFALPNFFFHLTTAYNILRGVGVSIGKRDFMGQMPS